MFRCNINKTKKNIKFNLRVFYKLASLLNSNLLENEILNQNQFSKTDLSRFTEDLLKIHEFYKIFKNDIFEILGQIEKYNQ